MKNLLLLFTCVLFCLGLQAQEGSVKGNIITNDGTPLEYVSVKIEGTTIGGQTDAQGQFEIVNVKEGEQTIKLSYVGYKSKIVTINVSGETTVGEFVLYQGNELLEEVLITKERSNPFSRKQSAYVSKLPLKNMENAQVYSTVTNELLVSQTVTTFEDALKNATGVDKLWASTGRGGDGAGYFNMRGFAIQPQLVNGLPGITNGTINSANVERIEVIKGPSATLFGSTVTSYGGLINIVTKKPYQGFGGSASFTTGSYGLNNVVFDVNTAIDKKENIYFRLNSAYHTEDSFQDAGFKKSLFVAPSITYKASDKLTLSLYSEISQAEQTNPTFLFLNRTVPVQWENLDALNYDTKKSFTSNELSIKNPSANIKAEMDYAFSDKIRSQTIVATGNTSSNGYYSYLWNDEYGLLTGGLSPNTKTFSLNVQKVNAKTTTFDIQQNFIADVKIGKMRNRTVLGVDYFSKTISDNSSGFAFVHNVNLQGDVVNYDNPYTDDFNPSTTADIETTPVYLTTSSIDNILANSANNNSKLKQNVFSTYINNVLNILPTLSVMTGLRYDLFDYRGNVNTKSDDEKEYTKGTFSPKLGIVFQPIKDQLSVFGNYQNGFSNVNPEFVPSDPANPASPQILKSYDLEQANQWEFGVKTNLFKNKLNATVSYYNITVKDKVIGFGAAKTQDGEVESNGYEIEINANPIKGLNVRAGYSKNDAEVTKSPTNTILIGKRYEEAGPEKTYNFWATYKFHNTFLKNFGIGFGFNGASEQNIMAGYPSVGTFNLPSYTVFNNSIFYQAKKYRIGLKLNNATNEAYYKGWSTINPQKPRTVLANIKYIF